MRKLIVEFIENSVAKCEDENRQIVEIDVSLLPEGVKSGDVLVCDGERYQISQSETDNRKEKMLDLQSRLFKKKK